MGFCIPGATAAWSRWCPRPEAPGPSGRLERRGAERAAAFRVSGGEVKFVDEVRIRVKAVGDLALGGAA